MARSRFWRRSKNYRPKRLLQQLEERIVLDAAVNPTQDNPNDHPTNQADTAHSAGAAAVPAGDTAGGNAGLVPQLPTTFEHVFGQELNVVLVANNLADVNAVSQAAGDNAHVITYDAAHDNLATITSMLQGIVASTGQHIDHLAIVGHGTQGNLVIGTDQIQFLSVTQYSGTFEALGQTLSADAQIQFFGCSVAGTGLGQAMIDTIAVYTAADTFASTDTTGGNAHDWTLEYASNSAVAMQSLLNVDALAADTTQLAAPTLVKNIDTSGSTSVTKFVEMGGKGYFVASDGLNTNQIFIYDPVAASTTLLSAGYTGASNLTVVNTAAGTRLFFTASDTNGSELWVTDGSAGPTHTYMVKDIFSGSSSSNPMNLTAFNSKLYFTAADSAYYSSPANNELWVSDGTLGNATKIKTFYPLGTPPGQYTGGYIPTNLTVYDNGSGAALYFAANDTPGVGLWKCDASNNVTLVHQFQAGVQSTGMPANLTVSQGKLFFSVSDGSTAHGNELWMTNGIPDGQPGASTTLIDIVTGTTGSNPTNLKDFGGKLYFSATDTAHGTDLWTYTASTSTLTSLDLVASSGSSTPTNLTVFGTKLYFSATDGTTAHGVELWATDGVTAPAMVSDINAGNGSSSPSSLTVSGGKLYFSASDGTTAGLHGTELWVTDGVTAPAMVSDINPGTANSGPALLADVAGKLLFTATDGLTGTEPWVSDGTAPGTHIIQNMNLSGVAPQWLTNVNGTLYFAASDPVHGLELWKSDGTTAGTTLVADIYPGTTSGMYTQYGYAPTVVNGVLYFLGMNSGSTDSQLYKLDSTGTPVPVVNMVNGYADRDTNFTGVGNTLYFLSQDFTNPLWSSDGTAAGTHAVASGTGSAITGDANLTNVNGTLFFTGTSTPTGNELFKVDPVTGQAVMVADLAPGNASSSPSNLTNVGGTLYFTATIGTTTSLYKTDGITITPVTNTPGVTAFSNLTNVNGTLLFTGTAAATGAELYMVDTTGAIVLAADIVGGPTASSPTNLYNANGELLFAATDSTNGQELWVYDTVNGAHLLKDINPGNVGSSPSLFTYFNGMTYFKATTAAGGVELWQTDGNFNNPNGTTIVGDIVAGTGSSNPAYLTGVNNTLFFVAGGAGIGNGLWEVTGLGTNNIPTATNMSPLPSTILEDPLVPLTLPNLGINDPDAGDVITVTLALDNASAGSLSTVPSVPGTITNTYNAATGFWSATGSLTEVQNALANCQFTPAPNWNGSVHITTHLQDAAVTGPANGLMTINVTAVNDAPLTSNLSLTATEDTSLVVSGWTFNDSKDQVVGGSTANTPVSVIINSLPTDGKLFNNGVEITALNNTVSWANAIGGLVTFQPNADWNGVTVPSFTFTVTDSGDTLNAGQNTSSVATADMTVTAVNDAPANQVPGGVLTVTQSDPASPYTSKPVTFSLGGPNGAISIYDVDLVVGQATTPTALYSVDLSTVSGGVATGNIKVIDVPGFVTITGGANDGTATSLTLTGTLTDINTALNGMSFIPYADSTLANHVYTGTSNAHLTITTHDNGNTGTGPVGGLSATNTVDFTVQALPHTPINTVTAINVLANHNPVINLAGALSVHDGDLGDTLFVDVKPGIGVTGIGYGTGTTFSPEYVLAGTESYLNNSVLSGLTAQVPGGFSGPATVLVTTTDATGLSATNTITINFAGPTAAAPPVVTTGAVGYTVYEDPGAPVNLGTCVGVSDGNLVTLSVDLLASAGWSGLNATAAGGATVTGNGTTALHLTGSVIDVQNTLATLNGSLITNFNGQATFGVAVSDGINLPVNATVGVPVIAVDDAPVNTVPVSPISFEGSLTFNGSVSVADVDAGTSSITTTLTSTHGNLALGLTVDPALIVTGNGTHTLVVQGDQSLIDTALNGLTYTPDTGAVIYAGTDTIQVVTNDNGNTGVGGPRTDTDNINLNVNLRNVGGVDYWVVNMVTAGSYTPQARNEIVYGTAGADTINATGLNYQYIMYGGDGNDALHGGNGAILYGGAGDDMLRLYGTGGQAFGDAGNDNICAVGNASGNTLNGGSGSDAMAVYDTAHNNVLNGDDGVGGGTDTDYLYAYGNAYGNTLKGDGGGDVLLVYDTAHNNVLNGHDGTGGGTETDTFYAYGNASGNTLNGEGGDDVVRVYGNASGNTVNGGGGIDVLAVYDTAHGNVLNGHDGVGGGTETDYLYAYGNAYGNTLNGDGGGDVLLVYDTAHNNVLNGHNGTGGGAEKDTFYAYGGAYGNTLNGEGGGDTLMIWGTARNNWLNGHDGTGGGTEADSFYAYDSASGNTLNGEGGDDVVRVYGNASGNTVNGGGGIDVLAVYGTAHGNVLNGHDGNGGGTDTDYLYAYGNAYGNTLNGDGGGDVLSVYDTAHNNVLNGHNGTGGGTEADTFYAYGSAYGNTLNGEGGGDTLTIWGAASNNVLDGGADNDTLTGSGTTAGNTYFGGTGADIITAGAGNDIISHGATLSNNSDGSTDIIRRGGGTDIVYSNAVPDADSVA